VREVETFHLALGIAALPALLVLPGYVLFAAWEGGGKPGQGRDTVEVLFLWIFSSLLLTSLSALALAELGRFSLPWLLLVVDGPILVLALLRRVWLYRPAFRLKWDRWQVALLVLLVVSGVLLFRPFENILGGRDGGVYVNTGVNIARTGAISVADALFQGVPQELREEFLWTVPGHLEATRIRFRFPGLYWVEERGIMSPQFLHLYPALVAIFYAASGLRGSLLVSSLCAWLASVAVYLVGRELFRREVGAVALAILTLNISQVWYARYANSEVLFQVLFWGALFLWVLFFRCRRPLYGLISGLGFGACLLAKLEAVLLLVPLLALALGTPTSPVACWGPRAYLARDGRGRSGLAWFVAPLALLCGWMVAHAALFSHRYLEMTSILVTSRALPPLAMALGLVGGASLGGAALGMTAWEFRRWGWGRLRSLALARPYLAGVVLLALTAGGWFYFREGLSQLGWYVTPLGLLLAGLGFIVALLGGRDEGRALLLCCSLLYAAILLRRSLISPDHIWAVRRFVPIVIPAAALFIAQGLWWLSEEGSSWARRLGPGTSKLGWGWFGRVLSLILGALVLIRSVQITAPIIRHREFGPAISQVQQVAAGLPEEALVILDGSWAANYISLPLRFIHSKRVLVFWPKPGESESFDLEALERMAGMGLSQGWEVFFISSVEMKTPSRDYEFVPVRSSRLSFPQLEHSVGRLPRKVEPWDLPYWVYQIRR